MKGFYSLSKDARIKLVAEIADRIRDDLKNGRVDELNTYFADEDTYIRKAAYLGVGRLYKADADLKSQIISTITQLLDSDDTKVRQTAVNAAGEIGITDFRPVEQIFEMGLFDAHHSVRNAVIGSIKKMAEKNPQPVLAFAKRFLHHEDKEIRREICHGIELRGRKHPQDILPLLKELQFDTTARVKNTLIHVIGQISYKKGCLEIVLKDLQFWENTALVRSAVKEIADVHIRYKDFAFFSPQEAKLLIEKHFANIPLT